MKTLEDFDRELGRGGEETLEVPAWIAEQVRRLSRRRKPPDSPIRGGRWI